MSDCPVFTYQTRLALTDTQEAALSAYADLYGKVERSLFAALQAGGTLNALKRDFLPRFGITARQFNAVRIGLEGKIDAIKQRRPGLIEEAKTRIAKAQKVIDKLEKQAQQIDAEKKNQALNKLHQKKRRIATLHHRLSAQKADQVSGKVRLCFGSKRLFHAQFHLNDNGYADHAQWKADWEKARSSQFFVLGSKDETAGCQGCQSRLSDDGSLILSLRLPDALTDWGKTIEIPDVRFAYGQDDLIAALQSSRRITGMTRSGKCIQKRTGTALSYRFVRDKKGWRVFASVEARPVDCVSHRGVGAIGIDINADHLALAETDRFGNLVGVKRVALVTKGKTTEQTKALIGDALAGIVAQAREAQKPLVIEKLDFKKKKAELEAVAPKQARMISSFAYGKVISGIKAAAFRAGIEVVEVNPAFTSVIGAVNHAQIKGISVHQGAAYAIARRGLGLSERPTVRQAMVPTRNGGHVTFALPARNRAKPVWSFWSKVRRSLKAAHRAHFRSGAAKAKPAPLRPHPALCSHWTSPAQLRGANRSQHGSGSVNDDLPW